ncbi:TPA: hypothetical protein HA246_01920 [Candidatus Woesearchaeota archaeon]|nr:hypothetical protein [Candidatus Woesearchaeota archaeon]
MSDIADQVAQPETVLADGFIDYIANELAGRENAACVDVVLTRQPSAEAANSQGLVVSAKYVIKDQNGREIYRSDDFYLGGIRTQGDLTNPEQASRERFSVTDLSRYVSKGIGDKYLSMGVIVTIGNSNGSTPASGTKASADSDRLPLTRE